MRRQFGRRGRPLEQEKKIHRTLRTTWIGMNRLLKSSRLCSRTEMSGKHQRFSNALDAEAIGAYLRRSVILFAGCAACL